MANRCTRVLEAFVTDFVIKLSSSCHVIIIHRDGEAKCFFLEKEAKTFFDTPMACTRAVIFLLQQPEMAAVMATCPRARRVLRPIACMLALRMLDPVKAKPLPPANITVPVADNAVAEDQAAMVAEKIAKPDCQCRQTHARFSTISNQPPLSLRALRGNPADPLQTPMDKKFLLLFPKRSASHTPLNPPSDRRLPRAGVAKAGR